MYNNQSVPADYDWMDIPAPRAAIIIYPRLCVDFEPRLGDFNGYYEIIVAGVLGT